MNSLFGIATTARSKNVRLNKCGRCAKYLGHDKAVVEFVVRVLQVNETFSSEECARQLKVGRRALVIHDLREQSAPRFPLRLGVVAAHPLESKVIPRRRTPRADATAPHRIVDRRPAILARNGSYHFGEAELFWNRRDRSVGCNVLADPHAHTKSCERCDDECDANRVTHIVLHRASSIVEHASERNGFSYDRHWRPTGGATVSVMF